MDDVAICTPTLNDILRLASTMRAADVAEIRAGGVHDDLQFAVVAAVRHSSLCWAAHIGADLACIFGVAPEGGRVMADTGSPWMLGTPALLRRRGALMRLAPAYIRRMLQAYPHLVNFVHAENTVAAQWLERLGFTMAPAEPHGVRGALFHRFEMHRHV